MAQSTPLVIFLLATLFFIKGIKLNNNKFLLLGSIVSAIGFFDRQTILIPAVSALLIIIINGIKLKNFKISLLGAFVKKAVINKQLMIVSLPLLVGVLFFSYVFITTGEFAYKNTAPSKYPTVGKLPQFGLNPIQSPGHIIYDIIFLGFFFLPFVFYTRQYVKPQSLVIIGSLIVASIAALSGRAFIIHTNKLFIFFAAFVFAYSGINLALAIIKHKKDTNITNYCLIALICAVLFTIFKIGNFQLYHYIMFFPFILIFLAVMIRQREPYILTIIALGIFGSLLTLNQVQFYEKLWGEVDVLLKMGVEPEDIQGHYVIDHWLNMRDDNPDAPYKLVWHNHAILNDFIDLSSVNIVYQKSVG